MKILKKISVFILIIMTLFATNTTAKANETTKYFAQRSNYEKTTAGIEVEYNHEEEKIIYTIPEDFKENNIYFNIVEDLKTILKGIYVPGANAPFNIEIVNNSEYDYKYLENSITIDTLSFEEEFATDYANYKDEVWSIYVDGKNYGKYIKDATAFDNTHIRASYSIRRTANGALINLFTNSNKFSNNYYEGCKIKNNIANSTNACKLIMTDEIIGNELIAQGYENGIKDLNKYYLDFYNNLYNTSATKLEDLPDEAIYGYGYTSSTRVAGILNGNVFNNYETNPEVNELGYNWFYNECLYITPNYDINGNKLGYSNMNSTFAIGSYMRKENPIFEDVLKEDLKNIASKTTENLRSFEMFLDGPKTVNVYQNMNFGFMMSFQLEREIVEGTVTVSYVDVDGNKLAETEMFKGEVGTEYFTDEKIFDGYILNNVIGEKNGQYIDGNIDVIYVYAIWGEGDAEDEETTTPEDEITPPNTGVEISTTDNQNQQKLEVSSTYIIYYDEKKKKFNR